MAFLLYLLIYVMMGINMFMGFWLVINVMKKKAYGDVMAPIIKKMRKFTTWNGIFMVVFCGIAGFFRVLFSGLDAVTGVSTTYGLMSFSWFVLFFIYALLIFVAYVKLGKVKVNLDNLKEYRKSMYLSIAFCAICVICAMVNMRYSYR